MKGENLLFQLTAPTLDGDEKILTPDALRFIKDLNKKFDEKRKKLLKKRVVVQKGWWEVFPVLYLKASGQPYFG